MFFPEGQPRVYLYGQPADLRRSFETMLVINSMPPDELQILVNRLRLANQ